MLQAPLNAMSKGAGNSSNTAEDMEQRASKTRDARPVPNGPPWQMISIFTPATGISGDTGGEDLWHLPYSYSVAAPSSWWSS